VNGRYMVDENGKRVGVLLDTPQTSWLHKAQR
jgi:hypothetical protein